MPNINFSTSMLTRLALSIGIIPPALYFYNKFENDENSGLSHKASIASKFLPLLVKPLSEFVSTQIEQQTNFDKSTKEGLKKAIKDFASALSNPQNLSPNITSENLDYLIDLYFVINVFKNSNSNSICNTQNTKDQITSYLANNIKHIQALTNGLIDCHKLSEPAITMIMYFAETTNTKIEGAIPPICKPLYVFAKGLISNATSEACFTHEETEELYDSATNIDAVEVFGQCNPL